MLDQSPIAYHSDGANQDKVTFVPLGAIKTGYSLKKGEEDETFKTFTWNLCNTVSTGSFRIRCGYRDDLFPTSRFKMAYDHLKDHDQSRAAREYLKILDLAAKQSQSGVDDALRWLMDQDQPISFEAVEVILMTNQSIPEVTEVEIDAVDLSLYDSLLQAVEVN